jgi:hypothetical protein
MSNTSLYGSAITEVVPISENTSPYSTTAIGVVSDTNTTSLYSNNDNFTTGTVTSAVTSVNGGTGISVNPTTGNVVVVNTGVTSIVAGSGIAVSAATGAVTITNTGIGTTYNIDASTVSGGANLNLTGSDATTDSVKFASGTGITVSRTDANTITIDNTAAPGGVTSITGTANQIIASSSTGAVTLSTPQDIATTSSPTFAGATLGAVTVGVATDNTITTTSSDLTITSSTGLINTNPIYMTPNNNSAIATGIGGTIADVGSLRDYWHVGGYSIGGAGNNDGALEIATANNGNEPIYVRQYSGGFSSGTTWPFGNSVLRTLTLLDASGNTDLPGNIAVNGGDITTTATTFNLVNATATTLNIGAAATTIGIGASTGTVTINNNTLNMPITNANIQMGGRSRIITARLDTTTTTPNQAFVTQTASSYHNIKFQVSVVSGSDYHSADVTITHDGTTSYITVSNEMWTNVSLTDWSTDISGANVRLLVTPTNAVTTYRALNTSVI